MADKVPKKYKKHVRALTVFNKDLTEEIFALWIGGMTLAEICNKFKGTEKQFSIQGIHRIKRLHNWDARRLKLEEQIEKDNNICIKKTNKEKVNTVNRMLSATIKILKTELNKFEKNPDAFLAEVEKTQKTPMWLTTGLSQLKEIFDFHDEIVNGKKTNDTVPTGNIGIVNITTEAKKQELNENEHTKALEALATIDVEIEENE